MIRLSISIVFRSLLQQYFFGTNPLRGQKRRWTVQRGFNTNTAVASAEVLESRQLLSTDSVFMSVSGDFSNATVIDSTNAAGITGINSQNLTFDVASPNIDNESSNSWITFTPKSGTLRNEQPTVIGYVDYFNGLGFHNIRFVELSLRFGETSEPLKLTLSFGQNYEMEAWGVFGWPDLYRAKTEIGRLKVYVYGIFPPGEATSAINDIPSAISQDEGFSRRGELRVAFFGVDANDQIAEAENLGVIDGEIIRNSQIAHSHDTDMYQFRGRQGQRIAFDIDTSSNSSLNARMRLYDGKGEFLEGNDDAGIRSNVGGAPYETLPSKDPYFEYTLPDSKMYYLAVSNTYNSPRPSSDGANDGANDGLDDFYGDLGLLPVSSAIGSYTLTLSDPDDQLVEATGFGVIDSPSHQKAGVLYSPKDVNMYAFDVASRGAVIAFDIDYNTFDGLPGRKTRIQLFGVNGQRLKFLSSFNNRAGIAQSDGDPTPFETHTEPYLEYRFASPGRYYISVSHSANSSFSGLTGQNDASSSQLLLRYKLTLTNMVSFQGYQNGRERGYSAQLSVPNKPGLKTIAARLFRGDGQPIQKAKETWIVIHGRVANAQQNWQIASALQSAVHKSAQVLLLDWSAGADDNILPLGLYGTRWVTTVAKFVESVLEVELGVKGRALSLVGHSWGSYVAYETAVRVGGKDGIGAIVALDPARRGADYDYKSVNFAAVSFYSWAFYGNPKVSSTLDFGNSDLARTADESYRLNWIGPTGLWQNSAAHALPRYVFVDILRGQLNSFLNINNLRRGKKSPKIQEDAMNGYEGYFNLTRVGSDRYQVSSFWYIDNATGDLDKDIFSEPWLFQEPL